MDVLINFVHLLATAVWIGGAITIHFILTPAARHINPGEAGKLLGVISKRFSIVAWTCIILLCITGYLKTPIDLFFDFTSDAGLTLAAKHIMVLAVILVGLVIGFVVVPALRKNVPREGQPPSPQFISAQRRLKMLSSVNTLLGLAILVSASLLW